MIERKNNYDNLKGILIFLVVLGHLLFSFSHYNSEAAVKLSCFIYFFHMPLFFIISGFFSKKRIVKKDITKFLLLFLLMNLSFTLYDYFTFCKFDLFVFKYSSWYLLLLVIYRMLIDNKKVKNIIEEHTKLFLVGSLLISVFVGFIKTELFILRIFENWFYFVIGYLMTKKNMEKLDKYSFVMAIILLFSFAIVLLVSVGYSTNIYYYLGYTYTRLFDVVVKFIICIVNVLIFCSSITLISKRKIPFIVNFGKYSLCIYVLHRIPTLLLNDIFINNKYFVIISFFIAFALCVVLSCKVVVKAFDKIVSFIIDNIQRNKLIIILECLLVLGLVLFELDSKNIINLNKKFDDNNISIGFVGDLILLENQVKYSKTQFGYNFDYMFKYTKKLFNDTDYNIGVLEGPSDDNVPYSVGNYNDGKELRLNFPGKFIKSIKNSGIDLVTVSTNHIYDRGYNSVLPTINNLNKYNLDYVGVSLGENDKTYQKKIININNLKVGVLAYTFYTNYPNDSENSSVIKYLCDPRSDQFEDVKDEIKEDFNYLKDQDVDLIIVLPHYGTEFNFDFSSYQDEWNKVFAEDGADIIFGDHSHVIGPISYYGDTVALSSPGNYVNSYNGQDSDISQYVKVYINRKTKKIEKTTVIPLLAKKAQKGYYPISLYDLGSKNKNDKRLMEALTIFGNIIFDDENIKLKKEYTVDKVERVKDDLLLSDNDKNSLMYKKIDSSNKICFIGDSITEGTMNDYNPWYLPLMENFDKDIVNISRGSFTSDDILNEFSDNIKRSNCDLAVINIGTNDIRYNMTDPNLYKENIYKIIDLIGNNNEVVLLSPWETYSMDKVIGDSVLIKKDLYGKYNEKLIEIADSKKNVFYINPIRYIKSYIYTIGEENYLLDGVHPNNDDGLKLYSYATLRGEYY